MRKERQAYQLASLFFCLKNKKGGKYLPPFYLLSDTDYMF